MRKILLATTAIVAMGAGSAMAADVTISGSFELGYKNSSQNDAYADTATVAEQLVVQQQLLAQLQETSYLLK